MIGDELDAAAIKAALTDVQALGCTMWAEARGDARDGSSLEERVAVGCVIRTRARTPGWWGDGLKAVCLRPLMFSCWNEGPDANHQRTMALAYLLVTGQPVTDPLAAETLAIAALVADGTILDRTGGADHYFAPAAMRPLGTLPVWARGHEPSAVIGSQWFYRLGLGA